VKLQTQSELAVLNRKMQQSMQNLEKSEERRLSAQAKLAQATESAEDAKRYATAFITLARVPLRMAPLRFKYTSTDSRFSETSVIAIS